VPDYFPALQRRSLPASLDRGATKALAREFNAIGLELVAIDHTGLAERAKVHVLGAVTRGAIDQAGQIADDVVACAQRNPFAGQLAADIAIGAQRAMKERIEFTNRRLG
jgi:hypothetical protein